MVETIGKVGKSAGCMFLENFPELTENEIIWWVPLEAPRGRNIKSHNRGRHKTDNLQTNQPFLPHRGWLKCETKDIQQKVPHKRRHNKPKRNIKQDKHQSRHLRMVGSTDYWRRRLGRALHPANPHPSFQYDSCISKDWMFGSLSEPKSGSV